MWKQIREARRNENGFTLIELLIVIVILGVLAGIVVFAVGGIQDKGQQNACKSDVKTVMVAAEAFYANGNNSRYAATMLELQTAGLLHGVPDTTVSYSSDNTTTPPTVSVTGKGGSPCAGFIG